MKKVSAAARLLARPRFATSFSNSVRVTVTSCRTSSFSFGSELSAEANRSTKSVPVVGRNSVYEGCTSGSATTAGAGDEGRLVVLGGVRAAVDFGFGDLDLATAILSSPPLS